MGGIFYSLALHLSLSGFSGWCDCGFNAFEVLGSFLPRELHWLTGGAKASLQADLDFHTDSATNLGREPLWRMSILSPHGCPD